MLSSPVAKRPSFNLLEISSHLRKHNYPKKGLSLIEKCGSESDNFIMATCGCGTTPINIKHACNRSFCPNCSKKRQRRLRRRLLPFLKHYKNSSMYQWRFLTVSPENYVDYNEGKEHLRKSWNKFIRRKYIQERVKGGFSIIETTNKGKGWNLHIHSLIYSKYLDNTYRGHCKHCNQNYLRWNKEEEKFYCANRNCMKKYGGIIRLPRIQKEFEASSGRSCMVDISKVRSQSSLLNYVLKYVSVEKGSFTKIDDFAFYLSNSVNDRQINAFGEFYNFKSQIKQYSLLSHPFRCPMCGEVVKFSFDSEINRILRDRKSLDPNELNFYLEKWQKN